MEALFLYLGLIAFLLLIAVLALRPSPPPMVVIVTEPASEIGVAPAVPLLLGLLFFLLAALAVTL
jgi:hypothetical protein